MTQREWLTAIGLAAVPTIAAAYFYFSLEQTPIRYLICNAAGENCFMIARMDKLETCETVKKFHSAL